ncbi:hypothetical protein V4R08_01985 [Nitrobacter sp. NHB1]|uniref:hypothetical protein n=1 Tax=Nitrobacter sp. NHB1 TaxID=3119830 RepID=UPI002FFF092B
MQLENATTPAWLKLHVDALKPISLTMKAVEIANRVIQAQQERDICADMDMQRWLRT